ESEIEQNSMEEYTMLRLRLAKGIDLLEFEEKFGISLEKAYPKITSFYKDEYLVKENGRVHFTPKGFFVSNFILSTILL
ncbi:MAG: coproporphyrinogen III oxidase, partial [Clostridia bacterium]|nr:coproporphyrinogen III oxidase [Clostridia bacterium]